MADKTYTQGHPLYHGEKFVMVTLTGGSDGMGGETAPEVNEGEEFIGLLTLNTSVAARVAEKQGVKNVYSMLVDKKLKVKALDIFKRVRDGKYFKIDSDPTDDETPAVATFDVKHFTAEEYILPT